MQYSNLIKINAQLILVFSAYYWCYIGAIWNKMPNILKKVDNLNTFKNKIKFYNLKSLSNPYVWIIGGHDYAFTL